MTTTDKTYNGWTNYETWAVNLWMDNSEGDQRYVRELASEAWHEATATEYSTRQQEAVYNLASRLKDMHDEVLPEAIQNTVYADLLNSALDRVNWHEIASALLENYSDDDTDEEDSDEQ
jgi:hypothetical protein